MNKHKELGQILEALSIQNELGNDAYMTYAGHVDQISISVYDGAWDAKQAVYEVKRYLEGSLVKNTDKSLSQIVKDILDVPTTSQTQSNQFNKLIENN